MAQGEIACPKCKKEMQEGFVTDHSYAQVLVARWIEGRPESGWFGPKLRGKKWLPIATAASPAAILSLTPNDPSLDGLGGR